MNLSTCERGNIPFISCMLSLAQRIMDKRHEDEPISSLVISFYFLSLFFPSFLCVIWVAERTISRISVLFTADCLQLAFNWKLSLRGGGPID
jgi:hypothetical protein